MNMDKKWIADKYKNGDEKQIIELKNQIFNENTDLDDWVWLFKDNPAGEALIGLARDGEVIAGQYTVVPVKMRIDGQIALCSQSLDTMTNPDYRGLGIFTALAEDVYKNAESDGQSFVYGFPNKASYPGFIKKLDWFDVCNIPYMIKILNFDKTVDSMKKNRVTKALYKTIGKLDSRTIHQVKKYPMINSLNIEQIRSFGTDHDSFWHKEMGNYTIIVDRDSDYLNWRYRTVNEKSYVIYSASIKKECKGYIVLRIRDEKGIATGYIVDLFVERGRTDIFQALLTRSIDYFNLTNVDRIKCWMPRHHEGSQILTKNGFIYRPIEYKLGVRILNRKLSRELIQNDKNWYFTIGDSDLI